MLYYADSDSKITRCPPGQIPFMRGVEIVKCLTSFDLTNMGLTNPQTNPQMQSQPKRKRKLKSVPGVSPRFNIDPTKVALGFGIGFGAILILSLLRGKRKKR